MKTIIGIGNQFRNDDAIGLLIVDLLDQLNQSYAVLHKVNTDIFSIDELIFADQKDKTANHQVLFVDALLNDDHLPGTIITLSYNPSQNQQEQWKSATSTHEIGILEYLSLLTKMKDDLPEFLLLGIVVKDTNYGEKVSEEVLNAMEKAVKLIELWLTTNTFDQKVTKIE